MISPDRISIVIPFHPGNTAEKDRCIESILHSFRACGFQDKEFPDIVSVQGVTIGDGKICTPERDREIALSRKRGTEIAFGRPSIDFVYECDSDIVVPPNWAFWATHILPRDVVCFPIVNQESPEFRPRWVTERREPSWDTHEPHPYYASELIGFSRHVWETLAAKKIAPWPLNGDNEDYTLCLALHAAGFTLTNGRCEVIAY